jgi:beta-xylosidase
MIFNYKIVFILLGLYFISFNVFSQMPEGWGDQGDGTYRNPVLPGDYSDISAIRVGDDYYAISSTFQLSPGVLVLHSIDLVNWEIIGHVVHDLTRITPELNWDKMNRYGRGIWAGSIRYYKDKFWVYFGTPDEGFFMSSATNPEGPWEPLHPLWRVSGWDDCCTLLDDDGQLYFIASNFALDPENNKKYNVHLFKMEPDGKRLIMESDTIIHQSKGSEANKLYKINGLYYHYYSEVNSKGGRQIMMRRSKSLYGEWETKQLNHVDRIKDRSPNQGGLLEVAPDKWYFFTQHGTGDWDGRPASLLPVTWIDGWPIIGKVGKDTIGSMVWKDVKPIMNNDKLSIKTSEEFESAYLNVQWEWNYQPRMDKWSLTDRKGFLRLNAFMPINPDDKNKILLRAGNTLSQRSMHTKENSVTIKMNIENMADGQYAGLSHLSTTNPTTFGIKQDNGIKLLIYNHDNKDDIADITVNQKNIWLQSTWDFNAVNSYSYSLDGKTYIPFGGASKLKWGGYRGDRIGIFNYNIKEEQGFVDIDWFRYSYTKDKN